MVAAGGWPPSVHAADETAQSTADETAQSTVGETAVSDWTTSVDKQLVSPEVWRLPPTGNLATASPAVSTSTANPAIAQPTVPTALTVKPVDGFAKPATKSSAPEPVANTPMALPGVSICDGLTGAAAKPQPVEKLWTGRFDLGLDGAEGNSQAFNLRFGFHANRKTEKTILTLGVDLLKQTANGDDTTNRAYGEGRNEWLFENSRWSCFIHSTVDYDEFKAYNVCDAADIGWGYRLIKNDDTTLIGRFGAGYSNYCGGVDDGKVFPEAVFGMSLEQKISKRQKIVGTVEYAPDIVDFRRYRIRSQAAYEVLLDEEMNLSMKLGILERYNSLQIGTQGNDFDYAAMIMWQF